MSNNTIILMFPESVAKEIQRKYKPEYVKKVSISQKLLENSIHKGTFKPYITAQEYFFSVFDEIGNFSLKDKKKIFMECMDEDEFWNLMDEYAKPIANKVLAETPQLPDPKAKEKLVLLQFPRELGEEILSHYRPEYCREIEIHYDMADHTKTIDCKPEYTMQEFLFKYFLNLDLDNVLKHPKGQRGISTNQLEKMASDLMAKDHFRRELEEYIKKAINDWLDKKHRSK